MLVASARTGEGPGQLGAWLFEHLGVMRVYPKVPGRPPDTDRPFTVRSGDTVYDVAMLLHRDIADNRRYARLWRYPQIQGLQVGADRIVSDWDILELHT